MFVWVRSTTYVVEELRPLKITPRSGESTSRRRATLLYSTAVRCCLLVGRVMRKKRRQLFCTSETTEILAPKLHLTLISSPVIPYWKVTVDFQLLSSV